MHTSYFVTSIIRQEVVAEVEEKHVLGKGGMLRYVGVAFCGELLFSRSFFFIIFFYYKKNIQKNKQFRVFRFFRLLFFSAKQGLHVLPDCI